MNRVEMSDLPARWRKSGGGRVLSFVQVATKTQVRAEDYLRMTFEHDAELVHGDIVERGMPDETHSAIQFLMLLRFGSLIQSYPLYPRPELRMKVAPNVYRIADIAVFAGTAPQRVPESPPLLVVEIVSQDDRYFDLMQKLEEYRQWGVAHIWVVDPMTKKLSVYYALGLQNASSFRLSEYSFEITPDGLFESI
jgi:Uma2 family endonuclease